jgi:predicted TPR repeat methyltransferase
VDVESTYDEVAAEYDTWVGAGSALADPTFEELVGTIKGQEVCSVACGQGREARFLGAQGAAVTGVDLSENLLALARRHEEADPLGISYLQGDAQTLEGLANNSFDGVVCYLALMDIPSVDSALQSIARYSGQAAGSSSRSPSHASRHRRPATSSTIRTRASGGQSGVTSARATGMVRACTETHFPSAPTTER